MPLKQAPIPVPRMLAAELFFLRRITPRRRAIAHFRQLRPGEELQLPHTELSHPEECGGKPEQAFDHAILKNECHR
jgi:hypothetical protein